jgi:hypothetical protein
MKMTLAVERPDGSGTFADADLTDDELRTRSTDELLELYCRPAIEALRLAETERLDQVLGPMETKH